MSRHRNTATSVVVTVDDGKDHRFGEGWVLDEVKPTRRPASEKKSEK